MVLDVITWHALLFNLRRNDESRIDIANHHVSYYKEQSA
jgi:hypothetical protein